MLCANKPIWLLVRFTLCTLYAWCPKKKLFKIFRKILKYLVVARVHYPGVRKIMKIKNFETFSSPPPCDVSPRVQRGVQVHVSSPPPVMLPLEFRGVCRYMFLNSATLIRPLPLKARVLGYEGARILGEKNVCNGVEHIPPPPNIQGKVQLSQLQFFQKSVIAKIMTFPMKSDSKNGEQSKIYNFINATSYHLVAQGT